MEKANDFRTNRAKRCRRVLLQRSIWAVCPVSLSTDLVVSPKCALVGLPEVAVGVDGPVGFGDARSEFGGNYSLPANHNGRAEYPGIRFSVGHFNLGLLASICHKSTNLILLNQLR